ncbi:MAG TPA: SRPBCC family protein [Candidatus Limnocylindrales bacterium]|nr:SRPBCC family protein [Candidatus Limnocylindrales bacterium]
MSRFEHTVTVDVPVREVYDQWTQFEEFPRFMEGVQNVVQQDDRTLQWTAEIGGRQRTWTAEITDQTPETRIAWKSVSGAENGGAVLFEPDGPDRTKVTLRMDVDPDGFVESVGDALGFVDRQTKADLEHFKSFIEERRQATGAWRGEIHGEEVVRR